jgi:hypothetical protein
LTELSHDSSDDGFHEIQLSGKQLVFLFMATTVVSVVIFLCGVLVGRGVKGDTVSAAESAAAPPAAVATPSEPAAAPPTGEPRTPAAKDYTYSSRLESEKPPNDSLKPSSEAKPPSEEPRPAPPPVTTPPAAAAGAVPPPASAATP